MTLRTQQIYEQAGEEGKKMNFLSVNKSILLTKKKTNPKHTDNLITSIQCENIQDQ